MLLRIISAEWELYHGEIEKVLLPTSAGFLGILPGHVNLASTLSAGMITYVSPEHSSSALSSFADHHHKISVEWGLFTIEHNMITVVAE
jgi:F-type H+-transporting ATPase subunit epsilon